MSRLNVEEKYFEWMYDLMCDDEYGDEYSYRKLFRYLHNMDFIYIIPRDANRAADGIDLRYRFAWDTGNACADSELEGPCSVLEMIIALAIRCEETIMDDPAIGDRTSQWFWKMIVNLGLGDMIDMRFDEIYVRDVIDRFLNREFKPDGRGGLFTIKDCDYDLRDIEIWTILCWYLNSIS